MKKEKSISLLSKDPNAVRSLESQRYISRDLQDAADSSEINAYEWFEDSVIQKRASVEFRKDNGKDSAVIKMKTLDPETGKEKEGIVYSTSDETEISRLKSISEGKTVIIDVDESGAEKQRR
jgi:hypothetical protein